jgi:hypothetical protein
VVAKPEPELSDVDQLRRLLVCRSTGRIPPDLVDWVLAELRGLGLSRELRAERDELLRQAASKLLGSPRGKARRLHAYLRGVIHATSPARFDALCLVNEAVRIDRALYRMSLKQLERILTRRPPGHRM